MHNFIFKNPTKVVFGRDTVSGLGEDAAQYGKKALLVYGRNSIKTGGLYDACVKSLTSAGMQVVEHGGVKPNPALSHVREGVRLCKEHAVDVIIAVGGGSSIDAAKGMAAGAKYSGDVWDFYCGKAGVKDALPLITVLTLAATGSEMNGGSVVTNEETKQKYAAMGAALYPKTSFLDPENTFTVPPLQTAYGAVDAVSHIAEGYFTTPEQSVNLQLELAEAVLRNIVRSSDAILQNPRDYEARADMMWSCTLALNGILSSGLGETVFINHAMEHSLSAIYDIPHGAGLAIVMCGWFEWKRTRGLEERLARFGRAVFCVTDKNDAKAARQCVAEFSDWCSGMKVPVTFSQAGIPFKDIPSIAENIMGNLAAWGVDEYSRKDIEEILNLAK